jgi:L-ribulose-5-phosphate 4-epimerase
MNEGVIKYNTSKQVKKNSIAVKDYRLIEKYRRKLNRLGLIGCYENGIGYGNISMIGRDGKILITASQTGHLKSLRPKHYTKLLKYDTTTMTLRYEGIGKASSETLTHCSLYESLKGTKAVIHIHNEKLWQALMNTGYPTVSADVEYGTKEMANAVKELFKKSRKKSGIFATAGHFEGVFVFADSAKAAYRLLRKATITSKSLF